MIYKKVTLRTATLGVALVGVFSLSAPAQASDGTITFTGTITANTCQVEGGGQNMEVKMPSISTSALKNDGDTSAASNFAIQLKGCTSTAKTVKLGFEVGPNVNPSTGRLKLNDGDGVAKNVEIGLYNKDDSAITIGDHGTVQGVTLADGGGTVMYRAKYVKTGAQAATAGAVNTNVTYSLIYD